jgi:hypothetical protein
MSGRRKRGIVAPEVYYLPMEADTYREAARVAIARLREAEAEIARLKALLNSPVVDDWLRGVRIEAAHQQERWGSKHDGGKTPPDWFWLVGYLAGKCLHAANGGDVDKAKHHTISTGAVLFNWWRAIAGDPPATMRPGIEPPEGEA